MIILGSNIEIFIMEDKLQETKSSNWDSHLMLSILKMGSINECANVKIQLSIKPATSNKSQSEGQMMGTNPSPSPI